MARWFAESLSKQFPPAMKYIALIARCRQTMGRGRKFFW